MHSSLYGSFAASDGFAPVSPSAQSAVNLTRHRDQSTNLNISVGSIASSAFQRSVRSASERSASHRGIPKSHSDPTGLLDGIEQLQNRLVGAESEKSFAEDEVVKLKAATETYSKLLNRQQQFHARSLLESFGIEEPRRGGVSSAASRDERRRHSTLLSRINGESVSDAKNDQHDRSRVLPTSQKELIDNERDLLDNERDRMSVCSVSSVRFNDRQQRNLEALRSELLGSKMKSQGSKNTKKKRKSKERERMKERREKESENCNGVDMDWVRQRVAKVKQDVQKERENLFDDVVREKYQANDTAQNTRTPVRKDDRHRITSLKVDTPPTKYAVDLSHLKGMKFVPPPFVAAKAITQSHSINVSLQQLLASLKSHNPILHQICLRLGPTATSDELALAFHAELTRLIAKSQKKLSQQLKLYDAIDQKMSFVTGTGKQELLKQTEELLVEMEREDTALNRLNQQLNNLQDHLDQERTSPCAHKRCKNAVPIQYTAHTVASLQKRTPLTHRSNLHKTQPIALRNLRQLQHAFELL